ncbi:MAG TPA: type IV pilus twitching motility protein PilT, partial [Pyrinomonadaceae bacterium]
PQIEIVSVNDPEFITTFSDTSTYEPPGRRDELYPQTESYEPPQNNFTQQQTSVSQPSFQAEQAFEQSQFVEPPQQQFAAPPVQQFYAPQEEPQANFVAASANPQAKARMNAMFQKMAEIGASDLHLSVSMPPMVRMDGKIKPLQSGEAAITPAMMRELLTSIMPAKNQEEFARRSDSDFAYEIPGLARFRANIFMDRKGMGGVFRIIPTKILTAEQLGLSPAIMHLCELSKGLVVVTGPTGSGKSTTLCAMIDSINKRREDHIITIEDPIEFTHENQRCLVNQREVHNHTDSFKDALRAALREDPDILLVGEMRDLETIAIAIETAETGHLVFGTLHTTTAASTIDRIIDQFPADRQQQIRVMLSESLKGVIAQTLLPKKGGGRVAALEVLIVTPAISNLIREGKTFQIPSAMQTGKQHGMIMLNDALFGLVQKGLVEPVDAYVKAVDKANFEALLQRNGFKL